MDDSVPVVPSTEGGAHPGRSSLLDLAAPKPWRRFVPLWLRSLIWVDSAKGYDAFLSYSWKSDSEVAPLIQSVIQRFLCPCYKLRAKTVFRDLSCLPAGSSLESELFDRLDRSTHIIVLASPEAVVSRGMEMEAQHWFSRQRDGQVLILVTSGEHDDWDSIRTHLLPPEVQNNLATEPLWIPLKHRRKQILANAKSHEVRSLLVEDLKQVILCLYPGRDWGELRGDERAQRRRALGLVSGLALLFLALAVAAFGFGRDAQTQGKIAIEQRRIAIERGNEAVAAAGQARESLKEVVRRLESQVASNDPRQVIIALEQLITVHRREPGKALAFIPDDRFGSYAFFLTLLTTLEDATRDAKTGVWDPAVNVTWYDALMYAVWIGGDLPTESQWEFAARGTDGRKYSWGNDEPRMTTDPTVPMLETSHPNRPSAAGIRGLSGTVWQWCRDVYGPYASSEQKDPTGPKEGFVRVLRGGSYHDRAEFLRAAYRFNYHPAVSTSNAGFRVVWNSSDSER